MIIWTFIKNDLESDWMLNKKGEKKTQGKLK